MLSKVKVFNKTEGIIKITSKNIKTGQLVEFPEVHNLLTENFMRAFFQYQGSNPFSFQGVGLRCGSGTAEPSSTDTQLSNDYAGSWYSSPSGYVSPTRSRTKIRSLKQFEFTFIYIIPASENYVGSLTELGLYTYLQLYYKNTQGTWTNKDDNLLTHSLLKDAEGNPYSIDKTALDQLNIEYTLKFSSAQLPLIFSFYSTSQSKTIPNKSTYKLIDNVHTFYGLCGWYYNFYGGVGVLRKYHGAKILGDYIYGIKNFATAWTASITDSPYRTKNGQSIEPPNSTFVETCDDQGHFTIPVRRVCVDWDKNKHYILGFSFSGPQSFYGFPIYDKNFLGFTLQNLENYSVGVGDGETTEFKPPLNYWKENTEKIYIDGVLQTRNVDYTCDAHNNVDNLAELLPMHHAILIDADWIPAKSNSEVASLLKPETAYITINNREIYVDPCMEVSGYDGSTQTPNERYPSIVPTKRPIQLEYSNNSEYDKDYDCYLGLLSTEKPFIFELPFDEIDIPWNVNTVYLYYGQNSSDVKFSVFYSNDKETWTAACENVTGYKSGMNYNTAPYIKKFSEWCEYDIGSDVTAKYWKVQLIYTGTLSPSSYTSLYSYFGFAIKHKGTNIRFTNPPAENAVITMDADTDIIYKDENNVIDIGTTFTL